MVIAYKLSCEEICDLKKSNDGWISLGEFKTAVQNRTSYPDEEDFDCDDYLEYTEFIAAVLEARGNIEEEKIAEAFDRLDSDNTGYITAQNLCKLLGKDYSPEKVQDIIEHADVDHDGRISYEDFVLGFRQKQRKTLSAMAC